MASPDGSGYGGRVTLTRAVVCGALAGAAAAIFQDAPAGNLAFQVSRYVGAMLAGGLLAWLVYWLLTRR